MEIRTRKVGEKSFVVSVTIDRDAFEKLWGLQEDFNLPGATYRLTCSHWQKEKRERVYVNIHRATQLVCSFHIEKTWDGYYVSNNAYMPHDMAQKVCSLLWKRVGGKKVYKTFSHGEIESITGLRGIIAFPTSIVGRQVGEGDRHDNCKHYTVTHPSGWKVRAQVVSRGWVEWVSAEHADYGEVWGDPNQWMKAESEEALRAFLSAHVPYSFLKEIE